jgi:branched-chain amino acid transport system substrate-binding protein
VKVVADYQAAQKAVDSSLEPGFVSLEGYLSGRLVVAALEMSGLDPTRADLLRLINDRRFDISGNIMTFGTAAYDIPARVFLTVIQLDGTFKAVERL